jgi:mono/diheme cytochrome c family protein
MTMDKIKIYRVLIFLLILLSACGTARRGEPIMGKMNLKNDQVKRGEIIFMQNCEKCHPGGEAGVGVAINNAPVPGFLKRFRVRSRAYYFGLGRMPSFKKHEISKAQLDDLIAYLKVLKKNDEDSKSSFVQK